MNNYLNKLKIIENNYKKHQQIEDFKQQLQDLCLVIDNQTKVVNETPFKASEGVSDIIAKMFNPNTKTDTIKTGFNTFDKKANGFLNGEFIVIGGRPGMGKTQMMVQLTTNIASQNKNVVFFNLEYTTEIIIQKLLANLGCLNSEIFYDNTNYNPEIESKLSGAINQLNKLPIYLYKNPSVQLHTLISQIKNIVAEKKINVVFIDCLQSILVGSLPLNQEKQTTIITRKLKQLAVELNIVLIVSSQLSRKFENSEHSYMRPKLTYLSESSSIENDADKIIFLLNLWNYGIEVDEHNKATTNKLELIVAKNKNGPLFDFYVTTDFHKSLVIDESDL